MVDVLCIGYACFDLFYYLDGFPAEDSKILVRRTEKSGGGPAANAAYLLSSWGAAAAFAGCLGNDREAEAILAEFRVPSFSSRAEGGIEETSVPGVHDAARKPGPKGRVL
jgi:sugar/nucleoside kinase (ribokinase family)